MLKKIDEYIKKFNLTEYINNENIGEFELKQYESGNFILMAGNSEKKLCFMVEGVAKVTVLSDEGKEMILDLVKPFDIFGDLEFVLEMKKMHNVEVVEKVVTLEIQTKNIPKNSPIYKLIAITLAQKLQKNAQRISNSQLLSSREIVINFIKENRSYVENYIKYHEMAKLIGFSERQLRRILSELQEENLIIKKDKKIYINEGF